MKEHASSETLKGTLQQLLFSPKGALEGLLMRVSGKAVQVSMARGAIDAAVLSRTIDESIVVKAAADHSPKTKKGAHPVFTLESLSTVIGKALKDTAGANGSATIKGVVAAIHYARHGQPNGVVLKSGEFIHLRPSGMEECALRVGSNVIADGDQRTTVLGTCLLEAR
jgi:hypothetical protein